MQPEQVRFTRQHEWCGEQDGLWLVGITQHAAEELGDVTFVELPEEGRAVKQGDDVAVVESVKAASDVYAPVDGVVAEANASLEEAPEQVNEAPYGAGWFVKLKDVDAAQAEALMDHAAYQKFLEEEAAG